MLNNIFTYYKNLPEIVRKILKRVVGSYLILMVICSAATYWYALQYGARVPLDGIPFLSVISIISSVILTAVSLITTLLTPDKTSNPLMYIAESLSNSEVHPTKEKVDTLIEDGSVLASKRVRTSILIGTLMTMLGAMLSIATMFTEFSNELPSPKWPHVFMFVTVVIFTMYILAVYTGHVSAKVITLVNRAIYWVAIGFVFYLLTGPYFRHILQTTRYGGGISVVVETTNDGIYSGNLFLVTKSNVVVWSDVKKQFFDLNKNEVVSIGTVQEGTIIMPPKRNFTNIFLHAEAACYRPPDANGIGECLQNTH